MRRRLRKKLQLAEFAHASAEVALQLRPEVALSAFIDRFFAEGTAPVGAVFSGAADPSTGRLTGFIELGLNTQAQARADRLGDWLRAAPELAAVQLGPALRMA